MTPTERIERLTEDMRHLVSHLNHYPATMHLISEDELRDLERASTILDRAAARRETARLSWNTDWAFTQRLEDDGVEGTVTNLIDRNVVVGWWESHDNLAFLADYMARHGETAQNIADMVEKPWQWTGEYEAAQDANAMELEADTPNNRKDTP